MTLTKRSQCKVDLATLERTGPLLNLRDMHMIDRTKLIQFAVALLSGKGRYGDENVRWANCQKYGDFWHIESLHASAEDAARACERTYRPGAHSACNVVDLFSGDFYDVDF